MAAWDAAIALPDVILGLGPRLSGSTQVELVLSRVGGASGWWLCQVCKRPQVHEIGADEADEGEQTGGRSAGRGRQSQHQKDDQGDGDLDTDGILAGAEEALDLEVLLDPAEEQLDLPAGLVEGCDVGGGRVEIVAERRSVRPSSVMTVTSRSAIPASG